MSKYKGLFTFDVENHRYVTVGAADGIIDCMDYKPSELTEPLIKDEKIRKAVRAWAEVLEIDEVVSYGTWSWIGLRTADIQACAPSKIEIDCYCSRNTLTPSKVYTIAELCGEEEE